MDHDPSRKRYIHFVWRQVAICHCDNHNGASLRVNGSGTVNGTLDAGNSRGNVQLTVNNGLVLNGTWQLGIATNGGVGGLNFSGSQRARV